MSQILSLNAVKNALQIDYDGILQVDHRRGKLVILDTKWQTETVVLINLVFTKPFAVLKKKKKHFSFM